MASLEFISGLLNACRDDSTPEGRWSFKNKDGEMNREESLYECTYNVFHLLLLRTLPFVRDFKMVECITDEFFMILTGPRNKNPHSNSFQSLHRKMLLKTVKMVADPVKQSLDIMSRSMEAIIECRRDSLPSFFIDAIEECLEEGKSITSLCNSPKDTEVESGQSKVVENEINRTDIDMNNEDSGNDWLKVNRNDMVHALWDSDDRWSNRGLVLVAGLLLYGTWTRRKRIARSSRSIGKCILSPLHEIAGAITLLKKG